MNTAMRPELSNKSKYKIEKHRYYELKHFCLQYPSWKKAYAALDSMSNNHYDLAGHSKTNIVSNPVEKCVEESLFFLERIEMIDGLVKEASPDLSSYILKGVTEGVSYDILKARLDVPCCRDVYYDAYRRFFWLLHQKRQ